MSRHSSALCSMVITVAVAAVGCGDKQLVIEARPAAASYCPHGDRFTRGFDVRDLLGLREDQATRKAARYGCFLQVVERDGKKLDLTADVDGLRIRVAVSRDVVIGLRGVS